MKEIDRGPLSNGPFSIGPGDTLRVHMHNTEGSKWEEVYEFSDFKTPVTVNVVIMYELENEMGVKKGYAVVLGEEK